MPELTLFERFGLTGIVIGLTALGARAVWRFVTTTYWPKWIEFRERQVKAQERIAELVGLLHQSIGTAIQKIELVTGEVQDIQENLSGLRGELRLPRSKRTRTTSNLNGSPEKS